MLSELVLFLLLLGIVLYRGWSLVAGSLALLAWAALLTASSGGMWLVLLATAAAVFVLNVESARQRWLVEPVFRMLRKAIPPMSKTEQEALEAGTTWWEKDLFSGAPDWDTFDRDRAARAWPTQEQSFLDNEVESTVPADR